MHQTLGIQVFLILSTINIIVSFACNCLLHSRDYRCKLGTKTPYRCIANHDDSPLEYPDCVPNKIWLLVRHGTRYPSKKYIRLMKDKLPELQEIILGNYQRNKTELTAEDVKLLANWKVSISEDDVKNLVEEGENEMIDLGERYQSRFPSVMPDTYNNRTYKFKYTATQRTEESAKHFVTGLFGRHNSQNVWYPKAEHRDPVLRFYKHCHRWRLEVDKNVSAQAETKKFLKSETYIKMLQDVSKRIGHPVDHETAYLMYVTCAFETAWQTNFESPWCKMFSLNDFKKLEFFQDLKYYWVDGYGHKLTYEQACPALRDMFDFFTSVEESSVSAYFSHSGAMLKLLALLRVAKDDQHLTHDLFPLYGTDRAWRTGIIDSFASNIAFVLYNCSSKGPSILFMHQERPLYLPGCPLNVPCPLSIMKALYPDHEEECQFAAMCSVADKVELQTDTDS